MENANLKAKVKWCVCAWKSMSLFFKELEWTSRAKWMTNERTNERANANKTIYKICKACFLKNFAIVLAFLYILLMPLSSSLSSKCVEVPLLLPLHTLVFLLALNFQQSTPSFFISLITPRLHSFAHGFDSNKKSLFMATEMKFLLSAEKKMWIGSAEESWIRKADRRSSQ